jgi:DNA-binding IclR family transcriptional regulator
MQRCEHCGHDVFICERCNRRIEPLSKGVIRALRRYGSLNGYQIARAMGYSKSRMYEILSEMVGSGEIVHNGGRKGYTLPEGALRLAA